MKALSLWQPWASLMAAGLKTIETRDWPTRYRGPLAIHAAKRPLTRMDKALMYEWACKGLLPSSWMGRELPFGAIVAVVDVLDCRRTDSLWGELSAKEAEYGNYESGRWGWITRNVRPLEPPIPWHGMQGLFEITDGLVIP